MPHRSLAAALVLVLGLGAPLSARADEVTLVRTEALVTVRPLLPRRVETPSFFAAVPEDVRLSRGARTAIIVTAIVVGTLLIVGVVAVSRPGHL